MTLALIVSSLAAAAPLQDAQKAFERGDFERALAVLEPSIPATESGPKLAAVHLLRGRCFAALGQTAQVETAFTLALMNDPEVRLDPKQVPPDLIETLRALALRLSGRLALAVSGLQPGDVVTIDGEPLSSPEQAQRVPIGRHAVAVRRDGREVLARDAVIRPGQETRLEATLEAPAAQAAATSGERGPFSAVVRTRIDVLRPGAAIEAGAELTLSWFRVGVHVAIARSVGLGLRPGVRIRLGDRVALGGFLEADAFFSQPVTVTLGGGVALDVRIAAGLELFVEASGQYAVSAVATDRLVYPLLGLGARWSF